MSAVTDISGKLGEYMLKGWVLTDGSCLNAGCNIPLMRSPNGVTPIQHFCANCDAVGSNPENRNPMPKPLVLSSPSVSSSSHVSRPSTPATDVSSSLSSPIFALPAETEESVRRRQQSDTASAEIGKRLLKGWAMLGDECPNVRCFGGPLVRPPKAGGGKDPRKECVICGTVYISENDNNGWEKLVSIDAAMQTKATGSSASGPTARESKVAPPDEIPQAPRLSDRPKAFLPESSQTYPKTTHLGVSNSSTLATLEATAISLERTLIALSEKLTILVQASVDPASISMMADAISKVTLTLTQVKQLLWAETRSPS